MIGRPEDVLSWIRTSVSHGFIDYPFLAEHDPFISGMRRAPACQQLRSEVKPRWEAMVEWERKRPRDDGNERNLRKADRRQHQMDHACRCGVDVHDGVCSHFSRAGLQSTFGVPLEGPVTAIAVRHWGALLARIGGMRVYGAYHPPVRRRVRDTRCVGAARRCVADSASRATALETPPPEVREDPIDDGGQGDEFRQRYNTERPHEAPGDATPASCYVPSPRPYRTTLDPIVYPGQFERRLASRTGDIRCKNRWVNASHLLTEPRSASKPSTTGL